MARVSTRSLPLRVLGIAAAIAATGFVAGACGVVGTGKVEQIDPPFGLSDTLPTTTTTTLPPTTEAPTTSGLETTTTPQVQSEQVRLYFIASGQLTYVTAQLPSPVALAQIVSALQNGPPEGELGTGLRSAVPGEPTVITVTTDGTGIARVDLPPDFFQGIPLGDQRLVTAQLVLTLTDSRGIGQVVFNQAVPKPSGEVIPAGQPLSFRDFQELLSSSVSGFSADTTTTTSTSTTLAP